MKQSKKNPKEIGFIEVEFGDKIIKRIRYADETVPKGQKDIVINGQLYVRMGDGVYCDGPPMTENEAKDFSNNVRMLLQKLLNDPVIIEAEKRYKNRTDKSISYYTFEELVRIDFRQLEFIKVFQESINKGELSNKDVVYFVEMNISILNEKLSDPTVSESKKQIIKHRIDKFQTIKVAFSHTKEKTNKVLPTGFISYLPDPQIKALYSQLQGGNYIDTDLDTFKLIFIDKPLPPEFKPIKKTKKLKLNILAFIVYDLFMVDNQRDLWSIAENCFDGVKAVTIKNSYYNAFKKTERKKPIGYEKFETILKQY